MTFLLATDQSSPPVVAEAMPGKRLRRGKHTRTHTDILSGRPAAAYNFGAASLVRIKTVIASRYKIRGGLKSAYGSFLFFFSTYPSQISFELATDSLLNKPIT
jgi:hypothetical protein